LSALTSYQSGREVCVADFHRFPPGKAGHVLSKAEWTVLAYFVQQGLEAFGSETPNPVSGESLAAVLGAFLAGYELRKGGANRRDEYYLGNLPEDCQPSSKGKDSEAKEKAAPEAVRKTVAEARRRTAEPTSRYLFAGRNLYVLLDEETFSGADALKRRAGLNQGQAHPRPVWFVLDELASLQQLPQLHTAITENRKSNNPVVLGFQGRSQLETRYGHEAEAMMSQPATKIFLRTSEPRAAKWISETIGEVEIERIRESRSSGQFPQYRNSKGYGLERQVESLVMASEISGLTPLHGYLKSGNLVVRMGFPYVTLANKQPAFIEREIKHWPRATEEPEAAAATVAEASSTLPEQKIAPHLKQAREQHLKWTQHQRFFE